MKNIETYPTGALGHAKAESKALAPHFDKLVRAIEKQPNDIVGALEPKLNELPANMMTVIEPQFNKLRTPTWHTWLIIVMSVISCGVSIATLFKH